MVNLSERWLIHAELWLFPTSADQCGQNTVLYIHLLLHNTGVGNSDPTVGHFGLFSTPLSCSPYTLYTVQFQFTGHSLDLSDNVLNDDWLFSTPLFIYNCVNDYMFINYQLCLLHVQVHECVHVHVQLLECSG